jgi:hypothetical protein
MHEHASKHTKNNEWGMEEANKDDITKQSGHNLLSVAVFLSHPNPTSSVFTLPFSRSGFF